MSEKAYADEHTRSIAEAWCVSMPPTPPMASWTAAVADSAPRIRDGDMAPAAQFPRRGFQEAMAITPLPAADDAQSRSLKRFISRQPAWKPGGELPWDALFSGLDGPRPRHSGPGVFGGHVYAQAPLAAARAVEEEDKSSESNGGPRGTLGIHVSSLCIRSRPCAVPRAA